MKKKDAKRRITFGQICRAAVFAAGVNVLLFVLLAGFKTSVPVNAQPGYGSHVSIVRPYEDRKPEPEPLIEEEPFQEPEIMEVDLDFDSPVAIDLRPVEIDPAAARPASGPVITAGAEPEISLLLSEEKVDIPPKEVSCPVPRYPRRAIRSGIEGVVTVKLLINEKGEVEKSRIVSVEGYEGFGRAVTDVVRRWRFRPARHKGKTVKVWALKRVRFRIED